MTSDTNYPDLSHNLQVKDIVFHKTTLTSDNCKNRGPQTTLTSDQLTSNLRDPVSPQVQQFTKTAYVTQENAILMTMVLL